MHQGHGAPDQAPRSRLKRINGLAARCLTRPPECFYENDLAKRVKPIRVRIGQGAYRTAQKPGKDKRAMALHLLIESESPLAGGTSHDSTLKKQAIPVDTSIVGTSPSIVGLIT